MPDTSSVREIGTLVLGAAALILNARGIVAKSRRPRVALALLASLTIPALLVGALLWYRAGREPEPPRQSAAAAVPAPPKAP